MKTRKRRRLVHLAHRDGGRPVHHWLFGYGSLIWRPGFAFQTRRPGYILGHTRRFWQGSTDHRGVPSSPGRVATLAPDPNGLTWGMAYRIEGPDRTGIMSDLDHREKGGYVRTVVTVHTDADQIPGAITYVADGSNPHFLGEAPLSEMVKQIDASEGPSGTNREYVLRLAESLREMGARDPHVFALARALGQLD